VSTLTLVLVVLLGFGGRWARRVGAVRWIRGRLAAPKLASTDGLHVRERVEVIQDLLGAQMRRRQRMTGRARPETVSVGARGMQASVQGACIRERAGAEKRGHHRACQS